ncbi:MAG: DUF1273 family protein [Clostridia bacterium]|nr:DUF1273 family protein [Clostridia bacterium]
MKEKTACFTGYRKIPTENLENISSRLEKTLIFYIKRGYRFFGAGGALGFDTLAAETVLKLKSKYPDIKLILVLPCLSQTRGWKEEDVEKYEIIKAKADKVVYTSREYTSGCMFKRNRHLVDNSSLCICYLTENSGGTAYTVSYAEERGLEIINIYEP